MTENSLQSRSASEPVVSTPRRLPGTAAPGLALAALVAGLAWAAERLAAGTVALPAILIALAIGIALNRIAARPALQPGLAFSVKTLLRASVALLGLRVSLGDIVDLGIITAALVAVAMAATVVVGFAAARGLGLTAGFGALAGASTAVCGASAALATATVVPRYPGKEADVVFVVVSVNALSTVAMLLYPLLCRTLGFDVQTAGIMLGATIHDVAQVAGAGFAMSDSTGNTAVIVKLFRVFLLLPVVLAIGWWLATPGDGATQARVPFPTFALVFLCLCILNSIAGAVPGAVPLYEPVRSVLVAASSWGLLIAIAALGLTTSVSALLAVGWRPVAVILATTITILGIATAALTLLQ